MRSVAYYLRLWIKNTGRSTATRVQVFAEELYRRGIDKKYVKEAHFLPMNLRWTHTGEVSSAGIGPKMGQHCELGVIFEPHAEDQTIIRPPRLPSGKTFLQLETQVKPFTGSSSLEPGTYRLHLRVAADNAKPQPFKVTISISGDWYDDEVTMLSKGIEVNVDMTVQNVRSLPTRSPRPERSPCLR